MTYPTFVQRKKTKVLIKDNKEICYYLMNG